MNHKEIESEYKNTDFDLKSNTPFDTLHNELKLSCIELHYTQSKDGNWHASYESNFDAHSLDFDEATNILLIIDALKALSKQAKAEFAACYLREFNLGFHCGDTWAFGHQISEAEVRSVAELECSIAVTHYPTRNSDGLQRI